MATGPAVSERWNKSVSGSLFARPSEKDE